MAMEAQAALLPRPRPRQRRIREYQRYQSSSQSRLQNLAGSSPQSASMRARPQVNITAKAYRRKAILTPRMMIPSMIATRYR